MTLSALLACDESLVIRIVTSEALFTAMFLPCVLEETFGAFIAVVLAFHASVFALVTAKTQTEVAVCARLIAPLRTRHLVFAIAAMSHRALTALTIGVVALWLRLPVAQLVAFGVRSAHAV